MKKNVLNLLENFKTMIIDPHIFRILDSTGFHRASVDLLYVRCYPKVKEQEAPFIQDKIWLSSQKGKRQWYSFNICRYGKTFNCRSFYKVLNVH